MGEKSVRRKKLRFLPHARTRPPVAASMHGHFLSFAPRCSDSYCDTSEKTPAPLAASAWLRAVQEILAVYLCVRVCVCLCGEGGAM